MMRPVGRAARRPPLSCIGRQARQARSGYSGAASPRGMAAPAANQDFNQLLGMDSGRMRARVRDLVRNFPPFARAVNAMVAFTVGSGARFQSLATLPDGSPDIPTRASASRIASGPGWSMPMWLAACTSANPAALQAAGVRVRRVPAALCPPAGQAPRSAGPANLRAGEPVQLAHRRSGAGQRYLAGHRVRHLDR